MGFAGEYRGKEELNGVELDNTGGHTLYFIPALQIFWRPIIFEITYWQAIAHDLNGLQLGETYKALAGITYLIR